jgi:DNA mismatch repair protein MutS
MVSQSAEFSTPMMQQYMQIKKQYPDCFLFFRMGDFYELFLEDAQKGAQILDITLTARAKGRDGKVPMAGVPHHALDSYLSRLIAAGHKAAICDQVSEASATGIVDREVIRIVTPGTVMDEKVLEHKQHNYLLSLYLEKGQMAVALADLSTGQCVVMQEPVTDLGHQLAAIADQYHPREAIIPPSLTHDLPVRDALRKIPGLHLFVFDQWDAFATHASSILKEQFQVRSLRTFELDDKPPAQQAAAALIGYLKTTQRSAVVHMRRIRLASNDDGMVLDRATMANLELFQTLREQQKQGSLIALLDQTKTAMGGRLLRLWVQHPLTEIEPITRRHEVVQMLYDQIPLRQQLRMQLESVRDIERIIGRLSVGLGNPKDLIGLKQSLASVSQIHRLLTRADTPLIKQLLPSLTGAVEQVAQLIDHWILPDPAFDPKGGGVIAAGVDQELDRLNTIVTSGKDWVLSLEAQERAATGISSLKVRFNKVFGFYIEVSKANLDAVPAHYQRKQTLVNAERFSTDELKSREEEILTAQQLKHDLEYQLFTQVVDQILEQVLPLQQAAEAIGQIDVLAAFADRAQCSRYTRPTMEPSGRQIQITAGRHPVVEQLVEEGMFVPNDTQLDHKSQQMILITGPNMAGKSVYIRQVAVIVLMAQIGSFVPADQATIGIVDRIFVRSGASDIITAGLSTFMVEMVETAQILTQATDRSLIVMDEIGRGTSTYDGISIAWAVAEYLLTTPGQKANTLFATHYHELQDLATQYPNQMTNAHMAVEEEAGQPVFLHTLMPGGASHSFGIAVARLAGVPEAVTTRAQDLLSSLQTKGMHTDHENPVKSIRKTESR